MSRRQYKLRCGSNRKKVATVYTRDSAVMRRLDALVIEFQEVFRCIDYRDIDKTYEMPKSAVSYRKPRKL